MRKRGCRAGDARRRPEKVLDAAWPCTTILRRLSLVCPYLDSCHFHFQSTLRNTTDSISSTLVLSVETESGLGKARFGREPC